MVTLEEKRDMIAKYPGEGIKISPHWPDEGEWGKQKIIDIINCMIFLSDFPESKEELEEYQEKFGYVIDKAYEIAKKEVGE